MTRSMLMMAAVTFGLNAFAGVIQSTATPAPTPIVCPVIQGLFKLDRGILGTNPQGKAFVIGSDWNLYTFAAEFRTLPMSTKFETKLTKVGRTIPTTKPVDAIILGLDQNMNPNRFLMLDSDGRFYYNQAPSDTWTVLTSSFPQLSSGEYVTGIDVRPGTGYFVVITNKSRVFVSKSVVSVYPPNLSLGGLSEMPAFNADTRVNTLMRAEVDSIFVLANYWNGTELRDRFLELKFNGSAFSWSEIWNFPSANASMGALLVEAVNGTYDGYVFMNFKNGTFMHRNKYTNSWAQMGPSFSIPCWTQP